MGVVVVDWVVIGAWWKAVAVVDMPLGEGLRLGLICEYSGIER